MQILGNSYLKRRIRNVYFVIICLVILLALLVTGCLPTTTVTTPEEFFNFDSATGTITGYDIAGGLDVFIPSTIGGVAVEHIGIDAFLEKYLTSVIIPDSVTSIDYLAFYNNQLTSITIGSGVAIEESLDTMGTNLGFKTVYDDGGKIAGTYNYTEGV